MQNELETKQRPVERQNNPSDKSMTFEHQLVAERYFQQDLNSNAHFSPGSVLIASIGTNWRDKSKDKVKAMLQYTRDKGYICRYMEMQVYHNNFPQASHASSRNAAVYEARIGGSQFVLCLDTDVLPEEDILVHLLEKNVGIITPFVIDPENDILLGGPIREPNTGVFIQRWLPQCFLLMKTAIFNCPEIRFGSDEAEDMFSLRCSLYGHQQIIDTSQVLEIASPPTRPDAMKFDRRMDYLRKVYDTPPVRNWISQEEYDKSAEGDSIVAVLGDESQFENKELTKIRVDEFEDRSVNAQEEDKIINLQEGDIVRGGRIVKND